MPKNGHVRPWCCKGCRSEYDKQRIEDRMITLVQTWFTACDMQDLTCERCNAMKTENLMSQCSKCGGEYSDTVNKEELMRKVNVFKNVAKEQELIRLSEIIGQYLGTI
jgi:DNA polymerase epsilon subunit 1